MVESVLNEEKVRDRQYLREVEDTILASPSIPSRGFGFYGGGTSGIGGGTSDTFDLSHVT